MFAKVTKGIDISHHNGSLDFARLCKRDKVRFAIIKAGQYKSNSFYDPMADIYIKNCEIANMPYGIYWFSYATTITEARLDARRCDVFLQRNNAKPLYPIYLDWEYSALEKLRKKGLPTTKEYISSIAEAFCLEMEERGYYVGIYANKDFLENYYTPALIKRFSLWYAWWTDKRKPDRDVRLWQYGTEKIYNGNDCDMNRCYYNFPRIIKEKHLNGW